MVLARPCDHWGLPDESRMPSFLLHLLGVFLCEQERPLFYKSVYIAVDSWILYAVVCNLTSSFNLMIHFPHIWLVEASRMCPSFFENFLGFCATETLFPALESALSRGEWVQVEDSTEKRRCGTRWAPDGWRVTLSPEAQRGNGCTCAYPPRGCVESSYVMDPRLYLQIFPIPTH